MALSLRDAREDKTVRAYEEDRDVKAYQRAYFLGVNQDLSDVDLEPGDTVPDVTGSEILSAKVEKNPGTAQEKAAVSGRKIKAWED